MRAIPLRRYLLFVAIVLLGTVADLTTKSWIFARLWQRPEVLEIVPGFVELEVSLNQGALFGIGQGMTRLFAALSILALLGVAYWLFWLGEIRKLWLCVALAAVTAGILGNLYDRLALHGMVWPPNYELAGEPIHAVRDWILLRYGDYRWPNFNIADSLLVCGAIMIGIEGLREQRRAASAGTDEGAPSNDD
ncbi:MAG: signal peptidase II [Planctomycetota bacterium]|nr:MAG: signal peptidase II [Planctomycetota bacterium]REK49273.1 MAG: signal peptidase II [Planctomycetota bacterium]